MKPRLIHPVTVKVKNVDTNATTYDADFDEPTGVVVYEAVQTLKAQVHFNRGLELEGKTTGFELRGDGYLLMERADADGVNINAVVTEIDGETVEHHVIEKRNAAHYATAHFTMVYFETREKGETV